ncbi:MAG: hypothetical protein ACW97Z_00285 [Candidatus Hodarchaeales archaeon]|jgi:hypothetical protein
MSLRELLDNFAVGFSVAGIFIQTPQELFPVVQENPNFYLAIKRIPTLEEGFLEINVGSEKFGLLVNILNEQLKILIVSNLKNINEIQAHWKRFAPVIREKVQIDDFIMQESIETRLFNRLEDIRISFQYSLIDFKEKTKVG